MIFRVSISSRNVLADALDEPIRQEWLETSATPSGPGVWDMDLTGASAELQAAALSASIGAGASVVLPGTGAIVARGVCVQPPTTVAEVRALRYDVGDVQPRLVRGVRWGFGLKRGADWLHEDDTDPDVEDVRVAPGGWPLVATSYRHLITPAGVRRQEMRTAFPAEDGTTAWHVVPGSFCVEKYSGPSVDEQGRIRRSKVTESVQAYAREAITASTPDPSGLLYVWLATLAAGVSAALGLVNEQVIQPGGLLPLYQDAGTIGPAISALIEADATTAWLDHVDTDTGLTTRAMILRDLMPLGTRMADLTEAQRVARGFPATGLDDNGDPVLTGAELYNDDGTVSTTGTGWTAWGTPFSGWGHWT